jgi:hypothetical protein
VLHFHVLLLSFFLFLRVFIFCVESGVGLAHLGSKGRALVAAALNLGLRKFLKAL